MNVLTVAIMISIPLLIVVGALIANHRSTMQSRGRVRPRSGRHTATPFNLGKIPGGRG